MKWPHILLAVLVSAIWGFNFVAAKSAVTYFPSFLLLALRVCLVVALLFPWLRKREIPFKKIAAISVTLALLHFGLTYVAFEIGLNASVAAVVDPIRVPFAMMLGWYFFKERIEMLSIMGMAVAFTGTLFVFGTPNAIEHVDAFVMFIASCAAWAFYNIQVKNLGRTNIFSMIAWVSLLSLPQLALLSFIYEDNHIEIIKTAPWQAWASLLYIVVGASIIAHIFWYKLLKDYPVNQVAPFTLLVPIFAVGFSVLLLNEQLTSWLLLGSVLTIMGVAMIVYRKPRTVKGGGAK